MNDVYSNPAYLKEIDDHFTYINKMLSSDPKKAYLEIRKHVRRINSNKELQDAVKCGSVSNCSFCCHDTIMMGKVEAEYIQNVINEKGIVPNKHRVSQQNNGSKIKWMDKACPLLLDENEKGERLCSIYEDRPLICMTHNSTEDPQGCNKEFDPNKVFREAKIAALDALSFSSFLLGEKDKRNTTQVALHEMLNQ
ncbi:MAG TPA: YkgJ family cysteine cluster protein [Flavobacterium sp.]